MQTVGLTIKSLQQNDREIVCRMVSLSNQQTTPVESSESSHDVISAGFDVIKRDVRQRRVSDDL